MLFMTAKRKTRRRGGGREARIALRANAVNKRPVRAGLQGGQYNPLSASDLAQINDAALEILETIGIGDPTPEVIEIATNAGAFVSEHGRLCFPKSLVEDLLATAARSYTVYSRNPKHADVFVGGNSVNYATSGEAVTMLDPDSKTYRASTLVDLYNCGRLVDTLDNIHQFGQTVIPTELQDLHVHDLNVAYVAIHATEKPCEMTFQDVANIEPAVEMFDMVAGGKGKFAERPFISFGGCPIVSPLKFGEDNLNVLIKSSQLGLISDIAIAPQAGATAPAALAGTLAQVTAEGLACVCIVNMIRPGCPMTFAIWPFVSDLRTGAFSGGSGEEALMMASCAQIGRYYDLPTSVAASMSDSKWPDAQAGYEKGITAVTAGLAGANRVLESAGMLGSLLGCSLEGLVIDNDMLGVAQRVLAGLEVNESTLSIDVIRETVLGPGHFLGHAQTISRMETDFLYPEIADRSAPGVWEAEGSPDIFDRARDVVKQVMKSHFPAHIDPDLDDAIRDKFPIVLPKEAMGR